ncbi:bifunctional oligoribonuclease/PAP phosphatase NrnA [Marinilabiliaceae bacterium JC017]|nr:bifunctional oligoribonuclease/PAP phosphatase NrnA [Marinilabiliaceae bacterium JC017]
MDRQELIDQLVEKISGVTDIVVVPHHNPDGDALGSALGLSGALKAMGKSVKVVSPNGFADFLAWMTDAAEVISYEQKPELARRYTANAQMIIMVDFNGLSRVRGMQSLLENSKAFRIMIDHHPDPEDAADIMISDPEVSSTCELVYSVLKGAGWNHYLSKELAECIYAGIMTDTGSLSYNSSRPETYHVVAELVERGIDKDKVHHLVFHSNSFSRMRLLGHSLGQKMVLIPECKAAYISLSTDELKRFDFKPGDTEGIVNYPLSIDGVNISALFTEKDDFVKISFRSRGSFPVNKFSEAHFNGGGHMNAAGGESKLSLAEAIRQFETLLPEFIANLESHS